MKRLTRIWNIPLSRIWSIPLALLTALTLCASLIPCAAYAATTQRTSALHTYTATPLTTSTAIGTNSSTAAHSTAANSTATHGSLLNAQAATGKSLPFVTGSKLDPTFKISSYARVGIDVSQWNTTINWKKVKLAGVQFAILRCGWGINTTAQDDTTFLYNVQGCRAAGIPFGIYLYSYATTTKAAKSEANHVLRLLKKIGAKPTLPVYYDLEEPSMASTKNRKLFGDMAETFCTAIQKAGYRAGVYSGLWWWNNYLTDNRFDQWDRWMAQWNSRCTYAGNYHIWQYASTGRVPGINGNVDMNYLMPFSDVPPENTFNTQGWLDKAIKSKLFSAPLKASVSAKAYTFRPTAKATRAWALTWLYRMAKPSSKATTKKARYQKNKTQFKDVKNKKFYTAAVNWFYQKKVLTTTGALSGKKSRILKPNTALSREELAIYLYRYAKKAGARMKNVPNRSYTTASDAAKVSSSAQQALEWCYDYQVVSGSTLRPKDNVTRAEAVQMILRTKSIVKK